MRSRNLLASVGAGIVALACGQSPTTPDSDTPQPRATSVTSTGPSVPNPQAPAAGAALTQPIGLSWSASTAGTPIIGYNWQVATTSAFSAVIAWGSTFEFATASPSALNTSLSGLANGTYFWQVQAVEQGTSATGPVQGGWSAPRSFSVTGPGATAPGTPSVTLPAAGAKFHPWELFDVSWSAVPGAAYYKLEMDDEPSFAYPWTNANYDPIYGTSTQLDLGPGTVYYRIRAVGTNGVRGLPSPTRTVVIDYNAPLPPPPTPLAPVNGARVAVPFNLQWSDSHSAQGGGYYEVQIAPSSSFRTVEWYVIGANASPYPVDALTAGTKWWRIRAYHGYTATGPAITAWSASGTFVVGP